MSESDIACYACNEKLVLWKCIRMNEHDRDGAITCFEELLDV